MAQRRATKKAVKPAAAQTATVEATTPTKSPFWSLTIGDVFKWSGSQAVAWAIPIALAGLLVSLGVLIGVAMGGGDSPGPGPEPGPGPRPGFEGLADEACDLALDCESDDRQGDARAMAGSLDDVVSRIKESELTTLKSAMAEAQRAVSSAIPEDHRDDWHPWSSGINRLLTRYNAENALVTADDAARAFTEISRGLSMSAEQ